MITALISESITLFASLPWIHIIVGVIVAHLIGWLWYGVFFNKEYMQITGAPKKTNWIALASNFIGLLMVGYLIGVFSLMSIGTLLAIDALIATILMMNLSNALFRFGNTKKALSFWAITAGYEVTAAFIIAVAVFSF